MIGFALNRLVSLLASLLVSSLVVFAAVEIVPGDPARFMLGINAQPDTVAALRAELGLDRSLVERYLSWVGGLLPVISGFPTLTARRCLKSSPNDCRSRCRWR